MNKCTLSFETVQDHFDRVLYPSHPVQQVHAPMIQTEPKQAEAKNNAGFFLYFVTRPDLVALKSLDDWFEDDGIDFMCLVHSLNIFDPTAWPRAT